MPALLTRMSQRPNFSSTSLASLATSSGEAMSHLQASASRPAAFTSFTVSSVAPLSAMTMLTPSSASRLANACPMPAPAPVMTATLSLCPLPMCPPASTKYASCPRLSRASTPSSYAAKQDVDGRDKPGHDD
jgi:hypothetical protein